MSSKADKNHLTLKQKADLCEMSMKPNFNDDDFSDIIESIENHENDDQNTELETFPSVTANEFLQSLSTVRDFIQSNGANESLYKALADMEAFGVKKKLSDYTNQSKITTFFK